MSDFELELKIDFLDEATRLIETVEQSFLALEKDWHNKEIINDIFRFAHNLKGTSRAVGFGQVAEYTHQFENLILKIKDGELKITEEIVDVLLDGVDFLDSMIMCLKSNLDSVVEMKAALKKIDDALNSQKESAGLHSEIVDDVHHEGVLKIDRPLAENVDSNSELKILSNAHNTTNNSSKVNDVENNHWQKNIVPELNDIKKQAFEQDDSKKQKAAMSNHQSGDESSIRVSLSRIETLNNYVGELVILQTVLHQKMQGHNDDHLLKTVGHLGKITKEIQEMAMSLRMIPVKTTLQKMNRIVRDTSKLLNKNVQLVLEGEDTEIDKTVLEHLADPLVHIVRNAVDHGLENSVDRVMLGKSEFGKIIILAFHEGDHLVIEVKDDGRGIDPEIIKKKAIEKGIIRAQENLSNEELIQLIFHPGFSTKEVTTEVSGRGVGMDVVKTNVERLAGEVLVVSKKGIGSTFRIVLPLTMAIVDALIVRVGEEKYILPLTQVKESLRPQEKQLQNLSGVGDCLILRGGIIPIFDVAKTMLKKRNSVDRKNCVVIVAQYDAQPFGVIVDEIILQQQVVIKKLGEEIRDQNGFMGCSILGDGRPSFILDIVGYYGKIVKEHKERIKQLSV